MTTNEIAEIHATTYRSALRMAPNLDHNLPRQPYWKLWRQSTRRRLGILNLASIAAFDHAAFFCSPDNGKGREEHDCIMDAIMITHMRLTLPGDGNPSMNAVNRRWALFSEIGESLVGQTFISEHPRKFQCGAYQLFQKCAELTNAPKDIHLDLLIWMNAYIEMSATYLGWCQLLRDTWPLVLETSRAVIADRPKRIEGPTP
jgi:hypothetical protein